VRKHLPTLVALGVVVALGAGGYAYWRYRDAEEARELAHQEAERAQRERDQLAHNIELVAHLENESRELMPGMLSGVALGMEREEVSHIRHAMAPSHQGGDPDKVFYEETLGNGATVMYGFQKRGLRLTQVQVLSLLPDVESLGPHLAAMNETYGSPTGVWDCPDAEGVPTRRFTWRKSLTTIADVFLIYRGRVSVTLYVAPSEVIGASLQRSRCVPVPRERLANFPVATDAQIGAHGDQAGVPGIRSGPNPRTLERGP